LRWRAEEGAQPPFYKELPHFGREALVGDHRVEVIQVREMAAKRLEHLLAMNPRLPREDCERRIHRWRK
jgi:hypothetical protein